MKDVPTEPNKIDAPKPTCRIALPKAKLHDMTVDKPITLCVSGTLKAMSPLYSDEDMYEIEIQDPHVEKMESKEEPKKDDKKEEPKEDMSNMPREKLKARIQKAMEEDKDDGK